MQVSGGMAGSRKIAAGSGGEGETKSDEIRGQSSGPRKTEAGPARRAPDSKEKEGEVTAIGCLPMRSRKRREDEGKRRNYTFGLKSGSL